jgi:hypothetical protein
MTMPFAALNEPARGKLERAPAKMNVDGLIE